MKLRRIFCLILTLMFALGSVSVAETSETADTLQKKFVRQLTGGNGIRGKINLTASGTAAWLDVLLPFTVPEIQIRAIGQKQGDMSSAIADDDAWQVKLYAENSVGQEVGTTWLYGDPAGMYLQSELLPETKLSLPVAQVNLLYQLFKGDWNDIFFAFDPLELKADGSHGNVSAYPAVAEVLGVPAAEWESTWLPVLEKYLLHLDLWLASYGDPFFMADDEGPTTLSATYTIPAEDIKREAKYLIGQMLFDNDLLDLLLPYVTMEQRITYLNPSLVYFYEACIDQLALDGDVVLSREMSALGESVSMSVSLPLPEMPNSLTAPIGELAAAALELPYNDLLAGMNRLTVIQKGNETNITLTGDVRTVALAVVETTGDEQATVMTGALRVTPNIGVDENSLSAAYECTYAHRVWQDENYLDHDLTAFSLSIKPLETLSAEDPFRNSYVDFDPLNIQWELDYRNNAYQEGSPVQVNISADALLPDAEISLEMVLRITTKLEMAALSADNAENLQLLDDERKTALLTQLIQKATQVMANLSSAVTETEQNSVPSMTE